VRDFFQWTGFGLAGEETHFTGPAVQFAFGILARVRFFPRTILLYQAWWSDHPVFICPPGLAAGKDRKLCVAHSNCEEVERFLMA